MNEELIDDERFDWLLDELNITTERAKERGLSPEEYLIGLRAYVETFEDNYKDVLSESYEEAVEGD